MIRVWRGKKSPRGIQHPFVPDGHELVVEYEVSDRIRVVPDLDPVSLTKQAPAQDLDINKMMARYQQTGVWMRNGRPPMYGDFTGAEDYHASLTRIVEMEQDFLHLPAEVRRYCGNDPGRFLDLVADPEARALLEEFGLAKASIPERVLAPGSEGTVGAAPAGAAEEKTVEVPPGE